LGAGREFIAETLRILGVRGQDLRQAIDQRSDVPSAEAVVDVHDADVGGTGVHHAQKGREPAKSSAVTNAGGHGDDGDANQASNHAGEGALHAGTNDHHARIGQCMPVGEQAMNSGDADVVEMLHIVAHDFGGHDGFFSDRNVAGARGNYRDRAPAMLSVIFLQYDRASHLPIFGFAHLLADRAELLGRGARCEDVAFVLGELLEDAGDLSRRLPFSEDDFGHARAQSAMVIDLGEAEILEGQVTQAGDGIVGRNLLLPNVFEKIANGLGIQRAGSPRALLTTFLA